MIEQPQQLGSSWKFRCDAIRRVRGFLACFVVAACGNEVLADDPTCDFEGPAFEAASWITSNRSPAPLASNRFHTRVAAQAFVDTLYSLGADSVLAVDVWDDDPIGTYTASLVVWLPSDDDERGSLFSLASREAVAEGFESDRDSGQGCIFLWWD